MVCESYFHKAATKQTKQSENEERDRRGYHPQDPGPEHILGTNYRGEEAWRPRQDWGATGHKGRQPGHPLGPGPSGACLQVGLWGVWQDHGVRYQLVKILVMACAPDIPFLTKSRRKTVRKITPIPGLPTVKPTSTAHHTKNLLAMTCTSLKSSCFTTCKYRQCCSFLILTPVIYFSYYIGWDLQNDGELQCDREQSYLVPDLIGTLPNFHLNYKV